MTVDVELPPLPLRLLHPKDLVYHAQTYARACIAHATAARDAEIEALRAAYRGQVIERANEIKLREKADAEIEALRAEVGTATQMHAITREHLEAAEAHAERLAEALRDYFNDPHADAETTLRKMSALLHEQEGGQRVVVDEEAEAWALLEKEYKASLRSTAAQENDDAEADTTLRRDPPR